MLGDQYSSNEEKVKGKQLGISRGIQSRTCPVPPLE
jgi:hypothetical protein